MTINLQDKNVIITGGSRGIGRAILDMFLKQGANVAFFGTNAETGMKVEEELKGTYPSQKIFFRAVNVSKYGEVENSIKEILETFGSIDVLINNAGITRDTLLMKMSEADWDEVLTTNLKACYNTCKAVTRPMLKARSGRIINITSVVGLIGNPGQTNYAASKAGMIGFTKSLAKELASRNILVNCIAPGFIQTAMTDVLPPTQKELLLSQIPMQRLGLPEEIAHVALFLASSLANYMTGQVLTVDGGMVMS